MKPDPKLEMIGHNVVIDNGTYTVKGGFSDNDNPQCSLPCLVGHGRHKGAMSSLGLKETYVGCAAQKLRGILDICHPIRQGSVQNWDDLEVLWSHILETELKTEGGAQPIIMTQPPLATQQEEDTMAEILVEKLGVPAFFIANKSVMSLYGGGQMTGIAVDSGHDTTYIVPSYQVNTDAAPGDWNGVDFYHFLFPLSLSQGNPVQEATLVLRLGGRHVTDQLMNQVSLLDSRDLHYTTHKSYSPPAPNTNIYKNSFFPSYSTANTPSLTTTSCSGERRRRQTSPFLQERRSSER